MERAVNPAEYQNRLEGKMKKAKCFILAAVFVTFVIIINNLLDFMLVQPGLARVMFHELETENPECLILGASHGSYGLSTEELDSGLAMNTMNMCIGGEYMIDAYYTLEYAVKTGSPKVVILDIDYQYLVNRHEESILFHQVYNGYPAGGEKIPYFFARIAKEEYRGAFLKWTNYWQCYYMIDKTVSKKLSKAYREYAASVVSMDKNDTYEGKGFIYKSKNASKAKTSVLEWDESLVSESECKYIEKIVSLCREHNIQILFTTVTQDPRTVAGQAEKFSQADSYIRNLAQKLNVEYYNFNYLTFEAFQREEDDFWDREGHMYGDTAKKFSDVYAEVIHKALTGTLRKEDYFGEHLNEIYEGVKPY